MAEVVVYKVLANRVYLGEAVHKGVAYPGEHVAIIDQRSWDKAHAAVERAANAEALAAIADRGIAAALEYGEIVESPATRGAVLISIWFDPADDGNLRRRVSYERALE